MAMLACADADLVTSLHIWDQQASVVSTNITNCIE